MGEIADMMLDGTLCEGCGTYMEGESIGIPRYCSVACARDRGATWDDKYEPNVPRFSRNKIKPSKAKSGTIACTVCKKRVKDAGLADHVRQVHPETQA